MSEIVLVGTKTELDAIAPIASRRARRVEQVLLDRTGDDVPLEVRLDAAYAAEDAVAVIVCGEGSRASLAARRATQAGLAVLLHVPIEDSLPVHYELTVIAEETGARLVPFWPVSFDPCLGKLEEWRRSFRTPLTLDVAVGAASRERMLLNSLTLEAYSVMHRLAGEVERLQVVPVAADRRLVVLEWPGRATGRLEILGDTEPFLRVAVSGDGIPGAVWKWSAESGCELQENGACTREPHRADWLRAQLIDAFLRDPRSPDLPSWGYALAALHIADAALESEEGRRAVTVVRALASRDTVFRATMTTWGCGLLWLLVLSLPLLGLLQFLGVRDTRPFALGLIALLVLFLLAQLLRPARRDS